MKKVIGIISLFLLLVAGIAQAIPPIPPISFPLTCTNGQMVIWNSTTKQWDTCADAAGSGDMAAAVWASGGLLKNSVGGTGMDSSASAGIPFVTAGTWSISNALTTTTLGASVATVTGTISAATGAITGTLTSGYFAPSRVVVTGTISAATGAITGTLTSGYLAPSSVVVTGTMASATAAVTGTLTSGYFAPSTAVITGTVSAATGAITGTLTSGYFAPSSVSVTGTMTAQTAVITGTMTLTGQTWKVFYTDGSSISTAVALGANGTYLKSNGASAAPTFDSPSGAGDVSGGSTSSDGEMVVYNSTSGKIIKQSGLTAGIVKLNASAVPSIAASDTDYVKTFAGIATGSNTTATMTVGAGGILTYTSTGAINASSFQGYTWAIPAAIGSGTPAAGTFTTFQASVATITGTISPALAIVTGTMQSATTSITGTMNAATAIITGTMQAQSATITGTLSPALAVVTGTIQAATSSITGTMNAATASITGTMSANVATITGTITAAVATISGTTAFNGNVTAGDADTDTLTIRSLIAGGNSRAVWIADTAPTPTYSTGATDLYVKRYIESAGGMYAPFFYATPSAGNVGITRIFEDPTNGTNYRGFTVPSALTQDLTFTYPNGVPSANQFFLLGAPSLNVSLMTYGTFDTGDFIVSAGTVSIKALGVDVAQINASGTPSASTVLYGNGSWGAVSAAADITGGEGAIQFNASGILVSSAGFNFDDTNKTLNITQNGSNPTITTGDGTYTWLNTPQVGIEGILEVQGAGYFGSTLAVAGDITLSKNTQTITHSGTTSLTITSTSGTVAIEGVTFSGGAMTGSIDMTSATYLKLPNGASPTTSAAGEAAIRTGAGAATGIQFYGNAAPGSILIPGYQIGSPIVIKSPTSTDDFPVVKVPYGITLRAVHYLALDGTSWTGQLQECDADGASCADTQGSDSVATSGTTTSVTSFTNAGIASGGWIALKSSAVSGSPRVLSISYEYTVD